VERVAQSARRVSLRINWAVERLCVLLLAVLVLNVWLGVVARYLIPIPITFTEELARYLMIWVALLAVSSGVVHRQHIGVGFVFERFPAGLRRWLSLGFSVVGCVFFLTICWYGLGFVDRGMNRVTMIYGMPRGYAFAAVPVAAALAALQLMLMGVQDFWGGRPPETTGTAVAGLAPEAELR